MDQFPDALFLLLLAGNQLLQAQGTTNDVVDRLTGIQRGHGILEDHLHLTAHGEIFLVAHGSDVFSIVDDLAFGGFIKLQNGTANGGFAAAGLTDQTEGLTFPDTEGNIVNRLQHSRCFTQALSPDGKMHFQALDIQ